MNVERLLTICLKIEKDLQKTNLLTHFSNIANTLQQITQNPSHPSFQHNLSNYLTQLEQACNQTDLDNIPPLWKQSMEEMGFHNLYGMHLYNFIADTIQKNQLTPIVAHGKIQEKLQLLTEKSNSISSIIKNFSVLNLYSDKIEKGHCEMGILIPRLFVKNDLNKLAKEFSELKSIILVFEEIVTSKRSTVTVNSIASSDFGLYIDMLPIVGASLSVAIERIFALYKNYLEIKKIKADLEAKNIPEQYLDGLKSHISEVVTKGLNELAEEILANKHQNIDVTRTNELKKELIVTLNKLSNRIDRGFNLEIRFNPEDLTSEEETPETKESLQKIKLASNSFNFINESHAPILFLKESDD